MEAKRSQINKLELMKAQTSDKSVGLVNWSWSSFHLDSLLYIKKAKELCDYLIVVMNYDNELIHESSDSSDNFDIKRKIISKIAELADDIVINDDNEKKWSLIRNIKPDVLIVIENEFTEFEMYNLEEYCKEIEVLPTKTNMASFSKIRRKIKDDYK